jgi:hypothetical protein
VWSRASLTKSPDAGITRPRLELSGPALAASLETLEASSRPDGGIERYVEALRLKVALFQEALSNGKAARLDEATLKGLCAHIAPVRRRIGPRLQKDGFHRFREAIVELLGDAPDQASVDDRMRRFCAQFPIDRQHRWVRDLAAELLHCSNPEVYPLMCRWVWDAEANTGVLREIWHGADRDRMTIEASDDYQTFLVLREELSQFLTGNGVFRDVPLYVDLLCAQVYAEYIVSQGGTYLRTDFSSPDDSLPYLRRLLGLDGINPRTGRTRLKAADGKAHTPDRMTLPD